MRIGDLDVCAISDGTFIARPRYFGDHVSSDAHPEFFNRNRAAWLPIGCFVIRSRERLVLVDAGLGPELQELPHGMYLVGGQLMTGLRALDIVPADVTDVVCTHLHSDHVGWLFDLDAQPVFPRARIWLGAADWRCFVDGVGEMADHIRQALRTDSHPDRIELVDQEIALTRGITLRLTPGHTPGHLCVVVSSRGERAIIMGDAITSPIQLNEPTWHSMGDDDPRLAARTREGLWQELGDSHTVGTAAHFPELRFGRVLTDTPRRWLT
jgi:glyoxylase-like metal-dependent hydrolase (beta-lactamase superfamily II)